MTAKRTKDDLPKARKLEKPATTPDASAAKGSVHEAIGKLIGDDTERKRGTAEKEAGGKMPGQRGKPPEP